MHVGVERNRAGESCAAKSAKRKQPSPPTFARRYALYLCVWCVCVGAAVMAAAFFFFFFLFPTVFFLCTRCKQKISPSGRGDPDFYGRTSAPAASRLETYPECSCMGLRFGNPVREDDDDGDDRQSVQVHSGEEGRECPSSHPPIAGQSAAPRPG